jgi:hypothetical protein
MLVLTTDETLVLLMKGEIYLSVLRFDIEFDLLSRAKFAVPC